MQGALQVSSSVMLAGWSGLYKPTARLLIKTCKSCFKTTTVSTKKQLTCQKPWRLPLDERFHKTSPSPLELFWPGSPDPPRSRPTPRPGFRRLTTSVHRGLPVRLPQDHCLRPLAGYLASRSFSPLRPHTQLHRPSLTQEDSPFTLRPPTPGGFLSPRRQRPITHTPPTTAKSRGASGSFFVADPPTKRDLTEAFLHVQQVTRHSQHIGKRKVAKLQLLKCFVNVWDC